MFHSAVHSDSSCFASFSRSVTAAFYGDQDQQQKRAAGFWTGFRTLFLGVTQHLFSQHRAYKLANVSHTLVSKVETSGVCERERVARVCCAALAECTPVHSHCGALTCSVPQEENCSARFANAATSSYLVDVSPITQSFARCVGLAGRFGLGRAHVRVDFSRLYSSSKPGSISDLCLALTLKCLARVASSLEEQQLYKNKKGTRCFPPHPFPPNEKCYKPQWVGSGLRALLDGSR